MFPKTTLLKIVLGLLQPNAGQVTVLGESPRRARRKVGYVPQYLRVSSDFPINVEQVVLMGTLSGFRPFSRYSAANRDAVKEQLDHLEIGSLARRPFSELSGGQQQRVLIARAMVADPEIVILDEPTASADPGAEQNIFKLLGEAAKSKTIIVVSHDVGFISSYVSRVACLNQTLVCHDTAHLTPELMDRLYGHHVHAIDHQH